MNESTMYNNIICDIPVKNYQCEKCDKNYDTSRGLRSHKNWHNDDYIDKQIKNAELLKKPKIKNIKCEHCSDLFGVENIQRHQKSCYLNPPNETKCLTCEKIIGNKQCIKFCSRSCSVKFNNKIRVRIKKPPKPYIKKRICKVCQRDSSECVKHFLCTKNLNFFNSIKNNFNLSIMDIPVENRFIEFEKFLNDIQNYYNENNITKTAEYFNYNWDIRNFQKILKSLNVKTRNIRDALINTHHKLGTYDNMTERELYWKKCTFKFNFHKLPIIGLEQVYTIGVYHPINNPNGVTRDHIVSISYGWKNNIDPRFISHPANCQIITQSHNSSKGAKCDMTADELIQKCNEWDEKYNIN